MGNAESCAKLIKSLKAIEPADWPSDDEFLQSVNRVGTGGAASTPAEKPLKDFIDTVMQIRDEMIDDITNHAVKQAVYNATVSDAAAASFARVFGTVAGTTSDFPAAATVSPAFEPGAAAASTFDSMKW